MAERIYRSVAKEKEEASLRAKRAEKFQGLEIDAGKILLVYFMRPPGLEALGFVRPQDSLPPAPLLSSPGHCEAIEGIVSYVWKV